MSKHFGTDVEVINCESGNLPANFEELDKPYLLKGLVNNWPLVKAAKQSEDDGVSEILKYYNKNPVGAFLAHAEAGGRFFYNDNVDGFNFVQSNVYLDEILNKLLEIRGLDGAPTYYVGSLEIQDSLPGFLDDNDLSLDYNNIRKSIWLGNRSLVATHFDFPDNIACCVLGQRRFTLFPPEQIENLYIGPMDLTPAGQQISMVNLTKPDLDKYPRFAKAMDAAMVAEMEPGDAVFVPSMWWHNVESLSNVNGLVNYWWRNTPEYMGSPTNPILHSLLSIKALPKRQRKALQCLFNHYVFDPPEDALEHLPEAARGSLGEFDETLARQIRAQLLNNLK